MISLRLPWLNSKAAIVAVGLIPTLVAAGAIGAPSRPAAAAISDTLFVSGYARLQIAEALAAVAEGLPGRYEYPYRRLESVWRRLELAQSADIVSGAGTPAAVEEPDAIDVGAALDSAWATLDSVAEEAFAHVAKQMDTRGGKRGAFVVFNPLGWSRHGTVRVLLPPVLPNAPRSERLVSLRDVPALGAMIVPIGEDGLPITPGWTTPPANVGPNWIENGYLRMEVDPRSGAITRIYDRIREREALRPGGRANVLWVFQDAALGEDSLRAPAPATVSEVGRVRTLSGSATPGFVTMAMEREWAGVTVRQELVLSREAAYVEVATQVNGLKEGQRLGVSFAPAAQSDSAVLGASQGSAERAGDPRSRVGRAAFEPPGQRWADVSNAGHGLSVLTDSEHEWRYREGTLLMGVAGPAGRADSAAASPRKAGRHRFRFAIYPHAGDWRAAGTHKLAAEYNVPLIAGFEPRHRGPLGERFSLAWSDAENVNVEWVKRAEGDPGVLVIRLLEWFGEEGMAGVSVACPRIEAYRSNELEERDLKLPVRDGHFRIQIGPRELATALVACDN